MVDKLNKLDDQAKQLENTEQGRSEPGFGRLNNSFASVLNTLQHSDTAPTTQAIAAVAEAQKQLQQLLKKWKELKSKQ